MKEKLKLLIIEDEALIADHLAMTLESLDYEVVDIVDNAEDAFEKLEQKTIDMALIDIKIIGDKNGIDVAHQINASYHIPFIFLTSNTDPATLEQVKQTNPAGFLVKPFQEKDLKPTIDISFFKAIQSKPITSINEPDIEDNYIFIKDKHILTRVNFDDIVYLEALDNYTKIFTKDQKFLMSKTLKAVSEKLPDATFLRLHRSYIVNFNFIESVLPKSVFVNGHEVPLSDSGRKIINNYIKTF